MPTTQPPEPPKPLLTIPQVARLLSLGKTKVYEMVYTDGLPIIRFGKSVRVHPDDLERWIAERRETA